MTKPTCHVCSKPLVTVVDGENEETDGNQYENCLPIRFDGGYGMFHDNIDRGCRYDVIICHECAHELCDLVPWIKDLINPHNSHSHGPVYRQENPDHYGWDYDLY